MADYLEYGGQIDVLYSDFEKAFDKVLHVRLTNFILMVLIRLLLNGYKIFLSGRRFRVRVKSVIGAVSGSRVLYPNFLLDS